MVRVGRLNVGSRLAQAVADVSARCGAPVNLTARPDSSEQRVE
jgi:hypothetical protein